MAPNAAAVSMNNAPPPPPPPPLPPPNVINEATATPNPTASSVSNFAPSAASDPRAALMEAIRSGKTLKVDLIFYNLLYSIILRYHS